MSYPSKKTGFSVCIIFLALTANICRAQGPAADIKIKLAQSYERTGDFESASRVYEDALKKDSLSPIIFDGLKRCYTQLKRYDDAIEIINRWLNFSSNDIGLLAQLGSTYILKSEEDLALKAWERAISMDPNRETTYLIVGSSMVQSRLFERAIELYRRGRVACNNNSLFSMDIAYLYSIMLNYAEATKEYLNLLNQNPTQLGFVQTRIAGYTERTEGLLATILVTENAALKEPENLSVRQLLAWLYMEGKDFNKAYEQYKFIDSSTRAGGSELYLFAERCLREKACSVALSAFEEIISKYPKFNQASAAKYGYARSLEESNHPVDTSAIFGSQILLTNPYGAGSGSNYSDAIDAYQRVADEYPSSEISAKSLLRIAAIKHQHLNDLSGAKELLEKIINNYARYNQVFSEAVMALGGVYVMLDRLGDAEKQYKFLEKNASSAVQLRQKASFCLAELEYFRGNFDTALTLFENLSANSSSDIANDAISLRLFIQENQKTNRQPLSAFAKADLLQRQNRLQEALSAVEQIIDKNGASEIMDEALMKSGDLLSALGRYREAIMQYSTILSKYPDSVYLDKILIRSAQLYEVGLKDGQKAIALYQQLLEQFPNSLFSGDARKHIRHLRGENL